MRQVQMRWGVQILQNGPINTRTSWASFFRAFISNIFRLGLLSGARLVPTLLANLLFYGWSAKSGTCWPARGRIAHRNTPTQTHTHTHRQKIDNRWKAKALNICVPHFVVYIFVVYTDLPNIDDLPKNGDSQGLPQTHTQTQCRDAPARHRRP